MGKLRSKDGCLTCRRRHVKCDQAKPVCGQCQKRNRPCRREEPSGIKIKSYRLPQAARAPSGTATPDGQATDVQEQPSLQARPPIVLRAETINAGTAASAGESFSGGEGCLPFHNEQGSVSSPYASRHTPLTSEHNAVVPPYLPSSGAPLITPPINTASPYYSVASIPISQLLQPESPNHWPIASPEATVTAPLTYKEACLVHHFATQLGRWLDCTDASRQFTRKIPALVKTSPILLHAVISYAARHVGDADVAEQAHERCVELLIPSLSSETVADDDVLLCAIVILRVFEQLNVMVTGSDQERHLAGCSALLRASQGREVDPSTPGLRQAAFWVYMRQCLYNACVYQQPPNVDPNLVLLPPPSGGDPISDPKSETAWANTMTWICATVVHFCFGSNYPEPLARMHKWRELYDAVESWRKNRPDTFDPIWYSDPVPGNSNPFPEIWFTADWHVMAFGFYHLACMLLIIYKPSPRFAVRGAHGALRETDVQVMKHARAICGACNSCPSVVPSLITLCHSTFIWGPLMTDQAEREGVIKLLRDMEQVHAWPTTWIINSLEEEWSMT